MPIDVFVDAGQMASTQAIPQLRQMIPQLSMLVQRLSASDRILNVPSMGQAAGSNASLAALEHKKSVRYRMQVT
ncbi:MAG: hypothetical protein ACR2IV_01930 [Bryobacteraceae bacterium]